MSYNQDKLNTQCLFSLTVEPPIVTTQAITDYD